MAAKRNATGLASAMPRASLNDEELVSQGCLPNAASVDMYVQRGDSPRALRFFGKIFEIEMLSPGGARTHDRGQLSKLFR